MDYIIDTSKEYTPGGTLPLVQIKKGESMETNKRMLREVESALNLFNFWHKKYLRGEKFSVSILIHAESRLNKAVTRFQEFHKPVRAVSDWIQVDL